MVAVSTIRGMAPAVLLSVFPKSAGSIARFSDDKYAPKEVRRATAVREATTLAQVGVYSAAIDRGFEVLKHKSQHMIQQGEKNLFTDAIQNLVTHKNVFLAGLVFTSNISAEMISRKLFPRNVWKKPEDKAAEPAPIKATLVDETKGREIPVEIEICEVMPGKRAKGNPRFEAAAPKSQPVQFASRSAATPASSMNPFQLKSPLSSVSSAVARPNFSV